jgi:F420-non-reducing hydrogenase iron-sulfur subunit
MCTGRVDSSFILRAFSNGMDGVFIGGCWLGECHYLTQGNYHAVSMMQLTRKVLRQIGVDPERLRIEWISASQGTRFADIMSDFARQIQQIGPLSLESDRTLQAKFDAARSIVPYLRLVERERLRVKFETKEEYEKFFNTEEVDRIYRESVGDNLEISRILSALKKGSMTTSEIARALGLSVREVSRLLGVAVKEKLTTFDENEKRFAAARA